MAMRAVASRLGSLKRATSYNRRMQSRTSSGSVLSEEERAAENIYIKKTEKEKLEKLGTQKAKLEESISKTSDPESGTPMVSSTPVKETSSDSTKNVAVAAGVVGLVASGWWYYRANKKVEQKEEQE